MGRFVTTHRQSSLNRMVERKQSTQKSDTGSIPISSTSAASNRIPTPSSRFCLVGPSNSNTLRKRLHGAAWPSLPTVATVVPPYAALPCDETSIYHPAHAKSLMNHRLDQKLHDVSSSDQRGLRILSWALRCLRHVAKYAHCVSVLRVDHSSAISQLQTDQLQ